MMRSWFQVGHAGSFNLVGLINSTLLVLLAIFYWVASPNDLITYQVVGFDFSRNVWIGVTTALAALGVASRLWFYLAARSGVFSTAAWTMIGLSWCVEQPKAIPGYVVVAWSIVMTREWIRWYAIH